MPSNSNSNTIISFIIGLVLSLVVIAISAHRWQQNERKANRQAAVTSTTPAPPPPPPTPQITPTKQPDSPPIEQPQIIEDANTIEEEAEEDVAELFKKEKEAQEAKAKALAEAQKEAKLKAQEEKRRIETVKAKEEEQRRLEAAKTAEIKAQEAKAKSLIEEAKKVDATPQKPAIDPSNPIKQDAKHAAPPTPIFAPNKPKVTTTTTFEDVKPELQQVPAKPAKVTQTQVQADSKASFWDDFKDIKVYKSIAFDIVCFTIIIGLFSAPLFEVQEGEERVDKVDIMINSFFCWIIIPFEIQQDIFHIYDPKYKELCYQCFFLNAKKSAPEKAKTKCANCGAPLSNWRCPECNASIKNFKKIIHCKKSLFEILDKNKHYKCLGCFENNENKKCPCGEIFEDKIFLNLRWLIFFGTLPIQIFIRSTPWVFLIGFYFLRKNKKKMKICLFFAKTQAVILAILSTLVFFRTKKI